MKVSRPITITLPDYGVLFAESAHAADFSMVERNDPYHKLLYVLTGRVDYVVTRQPGGSEARAGDVLVVPRGVTHKIVDREPATLLLLCLDGEFLGLDPDMGKLWLKLTQAPGRKLRLSRPARQRLEGMWRRAMVEKEYARVGGAVTARALAAQTLVLLARLPAEGAEATATARVGAVRREIDESFFDQWDLGRAATRAGLSRRRFTELFRAEAGSTFWNYLNERRLEHAARLLRGEGRSITGVIFACGFNDVSNFYRLFRRRFGAAPRAWLTKND